MYDPFIWMLIFFFGYFAMEECDLRVFIQIYVLDFEMEEESIN